MIFYYGVHPSFINAFLNDKYEDIIDQIQRCIFFIGLRKRERQKRR